MAAIEGIATRDDLDTQKQVILKKLDPFPELIQVVAARNWQVEAESHITPKLMRTIDVENRWGGALEKWVSFLATSPQPNSTKALMFLLMESRESTILRAHRHARSLNITQRDLTQIASKLWSQKPQSMALAVLAAESGDKQALLALAAALNTTPAQSRRNGSSAYRKDFLEMIEGMFANADEAARFVVQNASLLTWDPSVRKFRVER